LIFWHCRGDTAIEQGHGGTVLPCPPRFLSIDGPSGGCGTVADLNVHFWVPRSGHAGQPLGTWLGMSLSSSRVAIGLRPNDGSLRLVWVRHASRVWGLFPICLRLYLAGRSVSSREVSSTRKVFPVGSCRCGPPGPSLRSAVLHPGGGMLHLL
jgi:hypothetical protein